MNYEVYTCSSFVSFNFVVHVDDRFSNVLYTNVCMYVHIDYLSISKESKSFFKLIEFNNVAIQNSFYATQ